MNDIILKTLTDIGLNKKEALIYTSLLKFGEATVTEIAREANLNRTTLYAILEKLKNRGIVFKIKKRKKIHFTPEKPEELKRMTLENIRQFEKIVPELTALTQKNSRKPSVSFLDGKEGFRKIWDLILRSGLKEFLIIADPREMLGFAERGYITNTIIKKKIAAGIRSRQIAAFSEYTKEVLAKDREENRVSKVLPHYHKIPCVKIIFGDQVAVITPSNENMIILIRSEAYAKTERSLFEAMWEILK